MAVYTKVPRADLDAMMSQYALGRVEELHEILEGVENSNYLLKTQNEKYILTLYEKRVQPEDLPFFMDLMKHAALKGIPCPLPIADKNGNVLHTLCNRRAAIVSFLEGEMTDVITSEHCRQLGVALGNFHNAVKDFAAVRVNALSLPGWEKLAEDCKERGDTVDSGLCDLIKDELDHLRKNWPATNSLPHGVIHADLFPNNVFFNKGHLCGLIDFYFSCNDFLVYDVAICINAWCFENNTSFSQARMDMLLRGYESARPLSEAERKALPLLLRGAALRFLLTRLFDKLNHPEGALVRPLDPMEYVNKLRHFRTQATVVMGAA
jgi:homoserine kinase type II